MSSWHGEVVGLVLRRFPDDDAVAAFTAGKRFNGIATVSLLGHTAKLSGMLLRGPGFTHDDHQQIEALLKRYGVTEFIAKRHGKDRQLPTEKT